MKRKTKEVDISVTMDVKGEIETGDEVLDHLLTSLSFYMNRPLEIKVSSWDLRHHLWEDLGITLGQEIRDKIGDNSIARFGNTVMPMDDALVLVSVDISRPYMGMELDIEEDEEGFDPTLTREFLRALSNSLDATIHVVQLRGRNGHHVIEAVFKGLGVALGEALKESERLESTKGVL